MENILHEVAPLKKVSLFLSVDVPDGSGESTETSHPMKFIFGIGTDGLSHFEYMLAGKHVGDEVVLKVNQNDRYHQFAHLYRFLPRLPDHPDPVFLRIAITDISEPTQREIVTAMAEVAACGSDCGCGCGSH
jgi:hypothetical protein